MDSFTQVLIVVAVLLIAPLLGILISGVDRVVTARMQSRVGPPVLQPLYDIIKLFQKDPILLNRMQVVYAYLHLGLMMLVLTLLVMGQDILLILFVHAFAAIALVLGGMCVRSPYSRVGSQRKIIQMLAYEPVLVLMVMGIYLRDHSFMGYDLWVNGAIRGPLVISLPLIFLAFHMAAAIELQKSPFDVASSHHAHQEIVKGITLEYSGPYLGIIEIAHLYEIAILFIVFAAFWVYGTPVSIVIGCVMASLSFFALSVVDNICARMSTMWMLRYMWTAALGLSLANTVIWYVK